MNTSSDLIAAVKQLNSAEFDAFIDQVLKARRPSKVSTLSAKESRLLKQINRGLPEDICERYEQLSRKRRRRTLTIEEHAELLRLTDLFESCDADRAAALLELAKMRDVPLRVLIAQLGIEAMPVNG